MPDEKPNPLSSIFALLKDGFSIARELVLLVLFIILLFFPASLNTRLSKAGLTKIDGGVFTWQQQKEVTAAADQSKAAAQANSAATDLLTQTKAQLTAIAAQTTDESIRQQATATLQKVDGTLSSLHTADQSIVKSLVTQQNILQTAAAASPSAASAEPAAEGWIYLGEVDSARQHWMVPPQPKVDPSSPMPVAGQTITLTDDVYLRADRGPGQTYSQAAINGAVRSGSSAVITAVQQSSALNGGQFIWAKVRVSSGR